MAKKKTKSAAPKTTKKATTSSHGQLFDSHPNLKWLLPVFFVIAAIAILAMKNNPTDTGSANVSTSIDQSTINETMNSSDSASGY